MKHVNRKSLDIVAVYARWFKLNFKDSNTMFQIINKRELSQFNLHEKGKQKKKNFDCNVKSFLSMSNNYYV